MTLNGSQIEKLADAFFEQWDNPGLSLFLSDHLSVNLDNSVANYGDFKRRSVEMIQLLNSAMPPRDRELLDKLRQYAGSAEIRQLADDLLRPNYFSPTGDPVDAIVLDQFAFVDRSPLREVVRNRFMTPDGTGSRVLLVRGATPCGKSYSWKFLRHLAHVRGYEPILIRLRTADPVPVRLVDEIFRELDLDTSKLPAMVDDPQPSHIKPMIATLAGQLVNLARPYLLVIDDANQDTPRPILDTVYAIAAKVEERRPDRLLVALLGYNLPITDEDMRFVEQEDALFPTVDHLAEHFGQLAAGVVDIDPEDAREIAAGLLDKFPILTHNDPAAAPEDELFQRRKAAMMSLTPLIEAAGRKLRAGVLP